MGLETGPALLSTLNSAWPLSSDQRRFGAPHLRLIKAAVKGQFPGLSAAVTLSSAEMNQFIGFNVATINAVTLSGQTSAFYRDAGNLNAGVLANARVAEASVTQHQAVFALGSQQIFTTVKTVAASRAIVATDAEDILICNSASAIVITLDGGMIATGQSIGFIRRGAGAVTFAAGGGQTVRTPSGLSILLQQGKAVATYVGTNEWDLSGNI